MTDEDLFAFLRDGTPPDAIPELLQLLPSTESLDTKEVIVRVLTFEGARGQVGRALLDEFERNLDGGASRLLWAIANALSVAGTLDDAPAIRRLLGDPRSGNAREMLAIALGEIHDDAAEPLLIKCLADDSLAGHAAMALVKVGSRAALPALEKQRAHAKSWVRKVVGRAIEMIERHSDGD